MNKLEERHLKERFLKLVSGYCISFKEGDERAEKCVEITKEIAIGFARWNESAGFLEYQGKTYEQLFEMYLNTLK
jgi:hypothetical protein